MNKKQEPAAEWVEVSSLNPWPDNPRKNDEAVDKCAASIKEFGFGAPVVARKENREIIAGHTRLKAARKLGLTHVPVRFLDVSESDAHKLAIADNRTAEDAKWDGGKLSELLGGWADSGDSLEALGFSDGELDKLLGGEESIVETIDVSKARAEFFLSVHGPLELQSQALDELKRALSGITGLSVTITTTEL